MHPFYHEMADSDYRPLASTRTRNMWSLSPTNKQTNKQRVIARKSTGDTEGNASDLQPPLIPRNDTRLRKHTDGFPCPIFFQMIIFWVSQRVICVICFDVSEVHTAATSNSYGFNSRSLVPGE